MTTKRPSRPEGKAARPRNGGSRPGSNTTSASQKALITRNLRLAYDEVASEAIPDRMLRLLNQLEAATKDKPL